MRPLLHALTLATLLALGVEPAHAHEFWLAPSSYAPAPGDEVGIAAYVGTGFRGERRPYARARALRFVARGAGEIDLQRGAVEGDPTMARIRLSDSGGLLVGYESNFAAIALPASEFDAYLAEEGLTGPLAARRKLGTAAGPGRERYARCPKTWIAGPDTRRVTRPLGLPLEIVPLGDPAAHPRIQVRVLYRGRPLRDALVRGWRHDLAAELSPRDAAARDSVGSACEARTDRQGIATLDVGGQGEWLLSTVHMVPCRERAVADWESTWASLTFSRPDGPR